MINKLKGFGKMKIGGAERPYAVGTILQTDMFCEEFKIDLDEYWTKIGVLSEGKSVSTAKITSVFVWSCLYAGAMREYRACDFNYLDVLNWIDDAEETEENAQEFIKPYKLLMDMMLEVANSKKNSQPSIQTLKAKKAKSKKVTAKMKVQESSTIAKLNKAMK